MLNSVSLTHTAAVQQNKVVILSQKSTGFYPLHNIVLVVRGSSWLSGALLFNLSWLALVVRGIYVLFVKGCGSCQGYL